MSHKLLRLFSSSNIYNYAINDAFPKICPKEFAFTSIFKALKSMTKGLLKDKRNEHSLAVRGNGGQPICRKPLARRHSQHLEVLKRPRNQLQGLITNHHPLQPNLLQPRVRPGHGHDPRVHIPTPPFRHQVVVREMRLALDLHGSDLGEPSDQDPGAGGVAVADEDPAPAPPFDLVPGLADEGDRVAVLVGVDEGEHVL